MARELLSDESSSGESDVETGGAQLVPELKVNADFAKRFEHNKKREELQKLEEKLGKNSKKRKRGPQDDSESEEDSSSSEDEDDEGELATTALDSEIMATLKAIKSKDPRVYDTSTTFYSEIDATEQAAKQKQEKPVFLRDYHRTNLLNGSAPEQEEPLSYNQEQDLLKRSIVSEIKAAAEESDDDDEEEGGLFIRKNKATKSDLPTVEVDIKNADRDPETFLSNFMAARAWVPTDRSELHPFESDDEEEEKRAEEFEEAYNMRFEDPEKSNATLRSHARDIVQQYSVRRDEQNSRKKKRDAEKAAKAAAKQQLKDDKARLKKLRMEEIEEKVKRIKKAAGLKTGDLLPEDWSRFIDDEWDDDQWEAEMQRRFDDKYYAEQDPLSASEDGETDDTTKKKKPKKPKFDDDIDIKDIVPDFEDDGIEGAANFSLTEDEEESQPKKKSKKQDRIDKQKDSRKERRIIEQMVDEQLKLDLEHALPTASRTKSAGFRYHETSPLSFGLSSRDILLADDSALNQFAGIKKLASWRPEDKKKKDRKHLGKKARLRKWRLDTFGDEDGPEDVAMQDVRPNNVNTRDVSDEETGGVDIREGSRKKKGRRKKKAKLDMLDITT